MSDLLKTSEMLENEEIKEETKQNKEDEEKMEKLTSKIWSWTQQTKFLKLNVEAIKQIINEKFKKDKIRKAQLIIHDKDKNPDGTLKEEHIHVLIEYKNRSLNIRTLKKWFHEDNGHSFTKIYDYNNYAMYLTHESTSAIEEKKVKYNKEELTCWGTTYEEEKRKYEVIEKSKERRKELENLANEKKLRYLGMEPSVYWDGRKEEILRKIEKEEIKAPYEIKAAMEEWERMENPDLMERLIKALETKNDKNKKLFKNIRAVWISGKSGIGKTRYAKWYAKKEGYKSLDIATLDYSNDHCWDNYEGEKVIILNEFAGKKGVITMLKNLLDKEAVTNLQARYRNKDTRNLELVIFTSTLTIEEFFAWMRNNKEYTDETEGGMKQIFRRIEETIELGKDQYERRVYEKWNYSKEYYDNKENRPNRKWKGVFPNNAPYIKTDMNYVPMINEEGDIDENWLLDTSNDSLPFY